MTNNPNIPNYGKHPYPMTNTPTPEEKKKLEEISNEMRAQDNRATQYPIFVIMEHIKVTCPDGDGEKERSPHYETDDLCDDCKEKEENGKEIPELCYECPSSCFYYYRTERKPALSYGVFFTAKACEECIEANRHNLDDPISYGIGAFRNYEMQTVMKHLLSLTGEIPSHYV